MTGISPEVRNWCDVLDGYISKEIYLGINKESTLVVIGSKYPHLYDKFKVDMWVIKNNNSRVEYDHYKSGIYDGKYIVYLNMNLNRYVKDMLIHEVKHSYDDWNRIINGGKPIKDTWEIKNIYTKDFEDLVLNGSSKFPRLHKIVKLYYLSSKLETPAYLENELDNPGLGRYRKIGDLLMDYDTDSFYNKKNRPIKGLVSEFNKLNTEYNIPLFRKFKNIDSFLNYSKKRFNIRGRDIIKRVDKMIYTHIKK